MMELVACVFPHSDDEFGTEDELRDFLSNKLPKIQKGKYLLRKLGWKDKDFKAKVVPGSLVLFRKGAVVVGEAVVQEPIRELEPPLPDQTERGIPTTYYHEIVFNPESIRVYAKALPVETLENWVGRRLHPRLYATLGTRRDYQMFSEALAL